MRVEFVYKGEVKTYLLNVHGNLATLRDLLELAGYVEDREVFTIETRGGIAIGPECKLCNGDIIVANEKSEYCPLCGSTVNEDSTICTICLGNMDTQEVFKITMGDIADIINDNVVFNKLVTDENLRELKNEIQDYMYELSLNDFVISFFERISNREEKL